jgi:formate dehydrogenase
MIGRMKRGAYLVNTARGEICDPEAIGRALETGQLAGYATDTLLLRDAPVRIAGSTLSAQARYAAGVREVLDCWFDGFPVPGDYLILDRGRLTGLGARSYGIPG